jgi:hypothetical protein
MKYHMKSFIAVLPKKPKQFSKFGNIAKIPFYQLVFETIEKKT